MAKTATKVIAGVLALAGVFFVYKYFKPEDKEDKATPKEPSGGGGGSLPPQPSPSATDSFPLKKGSRGAKVKELQQAIVDNAEAKVVSMLGLVPTDGQFGAGTEKAVNALLGKKTVDSQADIDKIKGLKAQRDSSAAQQKQLAAKKELAAKLIALQKANLLKDFVAIKSTTGYGGKVTADGRFIRTSDTSYQPRNYLLKVGSFRVNKYSKKFNAYVSDSGDIVAYDENYYLLFNPNDTDVK
jgi:hypothetical protein